MVPGFGTVKDVENDFLPRQPKWPELRPFGPLERKKEYSNDADKVGSPFSTCKLLMEVGHTPSFS